MTDITQEFFNGMASDGHCFDGAHKQAPNGNPHIPTSSSHMGFEAGCFAKTGWYADDIKKVVQSRGYSVRVMFKHKSADSIIAIDYDNKQVFQKA